MSGHIVQSGLGETGRDVAEEFVRTHRIFVTVEKDPKCIAIRLKEFSGLLCVEGNQGTKVAWRAPTYTMRPAWCLPFG